MNKYLTTTIISAIVLLNFLFVNSNQVSQFDLSMLKASASPWNELLPFKPQPIYKTLGDSNEECFAPGGTSTTTGTISGNITSGPAGSVTVSSTGLEITVSDGGSADIDLNVDLTTNSQGAFLGYVQKCFTNCVSTEEDCKDDTCENMIDRAY